MFCIFAVQIKNFTFLCVFDYYTSYGQTNQLLDPWHVYEYTWCFRSNMP